MTRVIEKETDIINSQDNSSLHACMCGDKIEKLRKKCKVWMIWWRERRDNKNGSGRGTSSQVLAGFPGLPSDRTLSQCVLLSRVCSFLRVKTTWMRVGESTLHVRRVFVGFNDFKVRSLKKNFKLPEKWRLLLHSPISASVCGQVWVTICVSSMSKLWFSPAETTVCATTPSKDVRGSSQVGWVAEGWSVKFSNCQFFEGI